MPSSFSAELVSSNAALVALVRFRGGFTEFGIKFSAPSPAYGDNRSVNDMSRPGAVPGRSKGDLIRIELNQEIVRDGHARPLKISTDKNPIDYGTKPIGGKKYLKSIEFLINLAMAVAPRKTIALFIEVALARESV